MKYGHFSEDGSEYVVTRHDTPRPWINRFGNREYSLWISNTGGGFAIAGEIPQRLLNWYVPRLDRPGRYVYVRDDETGETWSPTYAPICRPLDHYECRHGLGWTTFVSRYKGLECEYTVFVPTEGPVELWMVKFTNRSRRRQRFTIFPFLEWSIDNKSQITSDLGYIGATNGFYEPAACAAVGSIRNHPRREFVQAFLMTDVPFDSWDANREAFYGPSRAYQNPIAVERGRCSNTPACAELAVAAMSKRCSLKPCASVRFNLMSGMAQTTRERLALRKRFLSNGAVDREYGKLRAFWDGLQRVFHLETPDKDFDRFVNRQLVRHVYTQSATHAVRYMRKEFRNYSQDVMGIQYLDPKISREIILKCAKHVLKSGETLGGWSLFDASELNMDHSASADPKLWLVLSTALYVRQTNDFEILEHRAPFYGASNEVTLWRKLETIVENSWRFRGPHGLSRMGGGDWNDLLKAPGPKGAAESVWTSILLYWVLDLMAELAGRKGLNKRRDELARRAAELGKNINAKGWDGKWYLRGYTDDGKPIGSKRSKQARLFLLPQAWAVLAGLASPERQKALFRAIDARLETEYGTKLLDRPFLKAEHGIGKITFVPGGFAENGSVYCHAASFKLCADGVAGRGNALYRSMRNLLPYTRDPDAMRGEPFVLNNFYRISDEPRLRGYTIKPWKTSTPSWVLRAVVEGLMGLQVHYDRLVFNPAVPSHWKRCSFRTVVQGDTYELEIRNPEGVENGVKEVRLDGKQLPGNEVKLVGDGGTHRVLITLGRNAKTAARR